MVPKTDLENDIRESYELIREYNQEISLLDDPKTKRRYEKRMEEQRKRINEKLEAYLPLCRQLRATPPEDIRQIIELCRGDAEKAIESRLEDTSFKRGQLTWLRKMLSNHFDMEEFKTLCYDVDVDYDDLPGEGKRGKARELVQYLERRGRVSDLLKVGREQRPDVPWDKVLKTSEEVDSFELRADLADILGVSLDEMNVLEKRVDALRLEMLSEIAERLITLYKDKDPAIRSLGIRVTSMTHTQPLPSTASLPAGKVPRATTKDAHTFRVSFEGKVIQGIKNDLKLVVKNTSSVDYKRVSLRLKAPSHTISLDPVKHSFFSLGATESQSHSIALEATQAGIYKIQVWASSVPAPEDDFLRAVLQLIVDPPPPKSIVEIEYI